MSGREQLSPKYQGIFDKAKTGRSMKSAIQAGCLICLGCATKAIKNCPESKTCPYWPYRPYQEIPYKAKRGNPKQILSRVHKGQIARKSKTAPLSVTKVVSIPKGHTGRLRVSIELEPENAS